MHISCMLELQILGNTKHDRKGRSFEQVCILSVLLGDVLSSKLLVSYLNNSLTLFQQCSQQEQRTNSWQLAQN